MGRARKNENSAAVFLERPQYTPPRIVEPDLETPGIIDISWKRPIFRAVDLVTLSMSSQVLSIFKRSKMIMIIPPIIRLIATIVLENKCLVMKLCSIRPIITEGVKAIRRFIIKFWELVSW